MLALAVKSEFPEAGPEVMTVMLCVRYIPNTMAVTVNLKLFCL